ncbi:MAG TPA: type II toxin-antitoxin system VapC family toxin [Solirubrobacterales bacterium]
MSAVLLDTHIVQWWSAEPERVSAAAREALEKADELAIAAISWYELAWQAQHERITITVPLRAWLDGLASHLRTIGMTPAIAETAVGLPASFPGDPADRLIYATAIENGLGLITKDQAIRAHDRPRSLTIW